MIQHTLTASRSASFTGHRAVEPPPQHDFFSQRVLSPDPDAYRRAVEQRLEEALAELIAAGYDTFLCGMAKGFDLMAGLAVCRHIDAGAPVRLIAAIPYPGQTAGFSSTEKEQYRTVLEHCAASHTISPTYHSRCFHQRNDFLVDNCSVLVCYYNGSRSGTQYTVRRALGRGIRVINLF